MKIFFFLTTIFLMLLERRAESGSVRAGGARRRDATTGDSSAASYWESIIQTSNSFPPNAPPSSSAEPVLTSTPSALSTLAPVGEDCDPSTKPECTTDDLCSVDTLSCNAVEGAVPTAYSWQCTHSPTVCAVGTSCDPTDGQCKLDDQLIPCVAVIDEDDSFPIYSNGTFKNQEILWSEFRALYPSRPFCLLIPTSSSPFDIVSVPENFLNDTNTIVHNRTFDRDNGNASLAVDWAQLCRLDLLSPGNVQYVGLFVDDSGSLNAYEVAASQELFLSRMEAKGIEVKTVVNTNENWILPFMTTLV